MTTMKDPVFWFLFGMCFAIFLSWAQQMASEARRAREEAERIEREQRLEFLKVITLCALYIAHRKRPDLFPRNPLQPSDKWPPS